MCVPFGIMLGWPSPTNPKLLAESSPIPINIDQSAMIAGFLMLGNILGTPFSSWSFLGTKYGITLGLFCMLIGWSIMWYAVNIYLLLGSRFLVGLGCGYGVGQLKIYIKELCVIPSLAQTLGKLVSFYIYFGVILAYIIGYFVSFTDFSMISTLITAVILVACFLLPHTPKEYLRFGKIRQAKTVLQYLKPNLDVEHEIQNMKMSLETEVQHLSFFQVLRDEDLRRKFAIIAFLTFFTQFSGAPATIIYSQIIFTASYCPYPGICAIAYAVLYLISHFIGVFYFKTFNRKICLLVSSISVTITLIVNIIVLYYNFNVTYWSYIFVITLFAYIFVHSTGLAVVPFMLTHEYFPEKARKVVTHFQIMQHSALALIITKVFQVLYDRFELYVPFCLFLCISFTSIFFILIFVPYKPPVLEEGINFKKPILL